MQCVFIMDPMQGIDLESDTTFALQRAALQRGHACFVTQLREVSWRNKEVRTSALPLSLCTEPPGYRLGGGVTVDLATCDAIFVRKDPPFDPSYLHLSLLLDQTPGKPVWVNAPRGLREANEKLYALHFAEHMPRTCVTAAPRVLVTFLEEIGGQGVIKPLDGAGGRGVMRLTLGDPNLRSLIDTLTEEGARHVMLQEFLPEVSQGDKRVLLLDGEILGAINRVAAEGDFRSNIHVGGSVYPCEVTPQERAIIEAMAPRLRADGLVFVGLDFVGGRLTEVNVTSPTGIQQLSRHRGRDMAEEVIAWVETHATTRPAPFLSSGPSPHEDI